MIITRSELANLLQVNSEYLRPSNFKHIQGGCKEIGYNLVSMTGRGKNASYELYPIETELPGEIWKPFPKDTRYQVSNLGRIKHPKGGILKGTNHKGYLRTRIGDLGQLSNHRIVMQTFKPIENSENFSVDHINGIRDDNRLENLRWVWQSENM